MKAQELIASDSNGKSDPFVIVKAGESRWRSITVYKTLEPVWDQCAPFAEVRLDELRWIVIELWDADVVAANEPLGQALIPVHHLASRQGNIEVVRLGRLNPKYKVSGHVWLAVECDPRLPSDAVLAPCADDATFATLCAEGASDPDGLGPVLAGVEELEACIRHVTLESGPLGLATPGEARGEG